MASDLARAVAGNGSGVIVPGVDDARKDMFMDSVLP
jgi:hypothetical protein